MDELLGVNDKSFAEHLKECPDDTIEDFRDLMFYSLQCDREKEKCLWP